MRLKTCKSVSSSLKWVSSPIRRSNFLPLCSSHVPFLISMELKHIRVFKDAQPLFRGFYPALNLFQIHIEEKLVSDMAVKDVYCSDPWLEMPTKPERRKAAVPMSVSRLDWKLQCKLPNWISKRTGEKQKNLQGKISGLLISIYLMRFLHSGVPHSRKFGGWVFLSFISCRFYCL